MTQNYQRRAIIGRNYHRKLSANILSRGKGGNYRNAGVSKNTDCMKYKQDY